MKDREKLGEILKLLYIYDCSKTIHTILVFNSKTDISTLAHVISQ